ncbi:MAG: hypothetical protein KJ574_00845 [Nanoarchaeota archaeon]|nr:hypothetical protein [Nanoarchaeota archaeon]
MAEQIPPQQQYQQYPGYRYTSRPPSPKSDTLLLTIVGLLTLLLLIGALYLYTKEEAKPQIQPPPEQVIAAEQPPAYQPQPTAPLLKDARERAVAQIMADENIPKEEAEKQYHNMMYSAIKNILQNRSAENLTPEQQFYAQEYYRYGNMTDEDAIYKLIALDVADYETKLNDTEFIFPLNALRAVIGESDFVMNRQDLKQTEEGYIIVEGDEIINLYIKKQVFGPDVDMYSVYSIAYGPDGRVVPELALPPANITIRSNESDIFLTYPLLFSRSLPRGLYVLEPVFYTEDHSLKNIYRIPVMHGKSFAINRILLSRDSFAGRYLDAENSVYLPDESAYIIFDVVGSMHVIEGSYAYDVTAALLIKDDSGMIVFDDPEFFSADVRPELNWDIVSVSQELNLTFPLGNYTMVLEATDEISKQSAIAYYNFTILSQEQWSAELANAQGDWAAIQAEVQE